MLNQNKVPFEENHLKVSPPLNSEDSVEMDKRREKKLFTSPLGCSGKLRAVRCCTDLHAPIQTALGSGRSWMTVRLPSATIPNAGPLPPRKWPQLPGPLRAVR